MSFRPLALVFALLLGVWLAPAAHADPEPSAITAKADRTEVEPGDLIQITGTVTVGNADPLGDAEVIITLADRRVENSTTYTSEDGTYATQVEVPQEESEGKVSLVVAFEGDEEYAPSKTELSLTISKEDEEPQQEATTEETTAPVTPPADSTDQEEADDDGVWTWFMIALLLVAVLASVVAALVGMRAFKKRDEERGDLDLLADPRTDGVEDPVYPEEGTVLNDDVSEPTDWVTNLPQVDEPLPGTLSDAPRDAGSSTAPPADAAPSPADDTPPAHASEDKPLFRDERDAPSPPARRGIAQE